MEQKKQISLKVTSGMFDELVKWSEKSYYPSVQEYLRMIISVHLEIMNEKEQRD